MVYIQYNGGTPNVKEVSTGGAHVQGLVVRLSFIYSNEAKDEVKSETF